MTSARGIRGAIKVDNNSRDEILSATTELVLKMIKVNEIEIDDIAAIFFTATTDLNAEFPAYAIRDLGWTMVPLLCAHEMDVPGAMAGVVRILLYVNTTRSQSEIQHLYLGDTQSLRPDLVKRNQKNDPAGENRETA